MPGFNITGSESGPPSNLETARKHRYRFIAFGDDLNDILLFAEKATRPQPEIDAIVAHHGQDEISFPGKNRWSTVDITFYEVLQGGGGPFDELSSSYDLVAKRIYDWWAVSVISLASSKLGPKPKRDCELALLDGRGEPVYTYQMYGCWPTKITPSELDYTATGLAEITVTLKMDKVRELAGPSEEE